MATALDVLFVLICLAAGGAGMVFLVHLRGERDHGPHCRACIWIGRALRSPHRSPGR